MGLLAQGEGCCISARAVCSGSRTGARQVVDTFIFQARIAPHAPAATIARHRDKKLSQILRAGRVPFPIHCEPNFFLHCLLILPCGPVDKDTVFSLLLEKQKGVRSSLFPTVISIHPA